MSTIACSQGHHNPDGARFCSSCGVSLFGLNGFTTVEASLPGLPPRTRLRDRYIILRTLARGGFGRTYLAEDIGRFNERVAIKELTPSFQGTSSLQKAEELFQREAVILYKLQHPQIPRFWEFFEEGKQLFLVQDFIEGETYQSLLEQRLQQSKCFNEAEIIELLRLLLPVLSYLHHQGVIHRDISPDNIICRAPDKLPVLIDLGGVKQVVNVVNQVAGGQNHFSPHTSTRLGKFGYAPDEQMRLGIVAPHSDLYALGVTAIVLMTGKQPQELIDPKTMYWIWDKYLNLSYPLKRIFNRMLATKPLERFQSADEILQLIEPLASAPTKNYPIGASSQTKTMFANNSGQGSLLDNSLEVPNEIQGWNWGAFLLPGVWCLTNQVWIGLVAWADPTLIFSCGIPWFTMGLILGIKGNEWAWKSRRWRSVAHFKAHQRAWTIASFFLVGLFLLLLLAIVGFIILIWLASIGN